MKFEILDLLNYSNIEDLMSNDSPNERAEIICNNLKKYMFIHEGILYKYDVDLIIYK